MMNHIEQITEYLRNHPAVSAVWLFGSMATGKAGKHSDIDIAVLFAENLSKFECFDLRLLLADELEWAVGKKVDMIDIAAAPLYLQHQIRKSGKLLVEKDKRRRVLFDVQSRREYLDLKPLLELRSQTMLKKVRTKGGRL